MSVLTALLSAAALSASPGAGPGLAGGPDEGAGAYPHGAHAPLQVRTEVMAHRSATHAHYERRAYSRAISDAGYDSAPAPRTVRLSPDFFYGPLTGGVGRPAVLVYPVRHGYVIHHAPSGPVSAGQAAAARGLGGAQ